MGKGEKRLSKAGVRKPSPFCLLCDTAISEEAVSFEKEFTQWPGKFSDSNLSPNIRLCRCLPNKEMGVSETWRKVVGSKENIRGLRMCN